MTYETALWHPFSSMAAVTGKEIILDSGEGCWVTDETGKRYLDGTASLWYCAVGHGRRSIAEAINAQLDRLEAFSIFGAYSNRPAMELADRLSALSPMSESKVFLTSGGGDADDTAIKMARQYHARRGEPGRTHVISREGSYHGTNGIGTALAGIPVNREGFGDYMPASSRVAPLSSEALEAEILRVGPENVAAFIFEPVTGAGGVLIPGEDYLAESVAICRSYGILTIADSVICGFGRLGTWFGVEQWATPDMITFAKGVTSGYQPLGGVIVSGEVAEPFWAPGAYPFRHGATYSGHPVGSAAALANLDILENERLLTRSLEMGAVLTRLLAPIAAKDSVREVRSGRGLVAAIEFDPALIKSAPDLPARIQYLAVERGVIVRGLGAAVAVSPPLTISESELQLLADTVCSVIDDVVRDIS